MYAAGPVRRDLMTGAASPHVRWVADLMATTTARAVTARCGDVTVSLSR
jgi:oxaloacetate decarboxylase (Na+ extruding) subunit alpha